MVKDATSLTIAVSKAVAPKAVDRNRIKRLIKEALLSLNAAGSSFKVIVKKNFADAKMQDVKRELSIFLKNA